MKHNNQPFRFKKFSVSHHRSSMKVGVDGVLIGAWFDCPESGRILDVGCGCGLIALMAAQRSETAQIDAIDIDEQSIEEACINFRNSSWNDRLNAFVLDFTEMDKIGSSLEPRYDRIVSNPPYFDSGIRNPETRREIARHQSALSPYSLIGLSSKLLKEGGRLAMVIPSGILKETEDYSRTTVLSPIRKLMVSGKANKEAKRVLIELEKQKTVSESATINEAMYIENEDGSYSDSYRKLCRDFYLKF